MSVCIFLLHGSQAVLIKAVTCITAMCDIMCVHLFIYIYDIYIYMIYMYLTSTFSSVDPGKIILHFQL